MDINGVIPLPPLTITKESYLQTECFHWLSVSINFLRQVTGQTSGSSLKQDHMGLQPRHQGGREEWVKRVYDIACGSNFLLS